MTESKNIQLCADDFGLDSGIAQGILKLAHMQRLSAVSCMVNMPDFVLHAPDLFALKNSIKIGLHFNLTEGHLISKPEMRCFQLNELLIKTHLRSVKLSFIANEFTAQLDKFVHEMHQFPDFIDGHQHVHQFPVVRQVILDIYKQRLKGQGVSIRSTWPCIHLPRYRFKANVLGFTGGKELQRQLCTLKIPHNPFFSGIYNFSPKTDYRALFRQWLSMAQENTLIMCHPGKGSNDKDPIGVSRVNELDYFLSDNFLKDCREHHIRIMNRHNM